MAKIRPLRLRDLPLAFRLAGRGTSFDTQLDLTVGKANLHYALLTGTGRTRFYILRQRGNRGLGVLHHPAEEQHARLAYLAPSLERGASETLWLNLLDGLAVVAGQRGVVNIIAEVDEDAHALDILRQAHFGIYARQDLWQRLPMSVDSTTNGLLRLADRVDDHAILALYGMLAPALIRQVESPPTAADACYVLDGPQGLYSVVAVHRGNHGVLIDVYLHPEVYQEAQAILNDALIALRAGTRPVYCRLRGYMGHLGNVLSDLGFEPLVTQAVMVRHTAVRITQHAFTLSPAVEQGGLTTTVPIREQESVLFSPGNIDARTVEDVG